MRLSKTLRRKKWIHYPPSLQAVVRAANLVQVGFRPGPGSVQAQDASVRLGVLLGRGVGVGLATSVLVMVGT